MIIVTSLVGNSLILVVIYKTPNLRKPMNYFVANMAVSDLLNPISEIPVNLALMYTDSWPIGGPFGRAWCKIVTFLGPVSAEVSSQNLILIAVDRFGAVVFPLRSPLIRSKLCSFFILSTWIVAVAVSSPYFFANELVEYPEGAWCAERWEKAFGESSSFADFTFASLMLFKYIPVILLAILYSIIITKLKTQQHPGEQSANIQQQRKRRNRNVLQMSIAIILVFVICFFPFDTNYLIIEYRESTRTDLSCGFQLYVDVTYCMAAAYCAINPIICFIFSSNYRQALKRLINCSAVVLK